jgi:phosphatidylserine/phosphatidylglycerophosphate/cardiolipin synthase-like enzyme
MGVSPSTWRFVRASRAHVVVDAAAYFDLIQAAMLRARQRILIVGWDFDTRIRLAQGRRWWNLPRRNRFPARLGAFIVWLSRRRRALDIRVLKWNVAAMQYLLKGTMAIDLLRWWFSRRIDFRFDKAHPIGCSHHQKIIVIDDTFAACGGIDVTADRWDTPEHREEDPRRRTPSGKPYGPWHDVSMLVEGEAAAALGDLGRTRWLRSGGEPLVACRPQSATAWPERLRAEFRDVEIGIARTRAGWHDCPEIREVEALFLEHIARARRFIYAESQYFASRKVAEAFARRLSEPEPPEVVLINPVTADGWLQQQAMDTARVRLLHALAEHDPARRMRVYTPLASGGSQIYVHAKLMIVDDEVLRVGSANMNNRSMGLDSECDVYMDAARPGNGHIAADITRLRHALIAEHSGLPVEAVAQGLASGMSMAQVIDSAPRSGKHLAPFELRALTETEKALADNSLLDAETPEEIFEPISQRKGLFRKGGILRRPD